MKLCYFAAGLMLLSFNLLADHSLADAMIRNKSLADKVYRLMDKKRVTCDLEFSNQTLLDLEVEVKYGNGFKQIALCFRTEEELKAARSQIINGSELGFYGLNGLVGILVANYTWENYQPAKVISVVYK